MASAYLLLRADEDDCARSVWPLWVSGALAGLLFLVRPTNLVFMVALLAFAVVRFRWRAVLFALGFALTLVPSLAWNWLSFYSLLGSSIYQGHNYYFSLGTFVSGLVGLAVSPSRGLVPNSPFLLFTATGIGLASLCMVRALTHWRDRVCTADMLLFGMLLGASAILYLNYSFSPFWEGSSYGSRYISETMPIITYFLNWSTTPQPGAIKQKGRRVLVSVFSAFVAIGVLQQVTAIAGGHKGAWLWSNLPISIIDLPEDQRWVYMREAPSRSFGTRLWDIRDGLVERVWRGVYSKNFLMSPSIALATGYSVRCKASIISVEDAKGLQVDKFRLNSVDRSRPYAEMLFELYSAGRKFVRARIRNDGDVPLYGYQNGLYWGFSAMAHKVLNQDGETVYENGTVHVSGIIKPGETGEAFGSMEFSLSRGRYRIEGRMVVNGIGDCGTVVYLGTMEVE